MTNVFFIIVFLIFTAAFIFALPVYAENWVLIEEMGVGTVMLDTDSIRRNVGSVVSGFVKIASHMRGTASSREVQEVITLYEFDCVKNVFRTADPIYYFKDGSKEKVKETMPWQDSDDTLTLTLKKYLCK